MENNEKKEKDLMEKASDAMDDAKRKASDIADTLGEKFENAKEKAGDMADNAAEKGRQISEDVSEKLEDAGKAVKEGADAAQSKIEEGYESVKNKLGIDERKETAPYGSGGGNGNYGSTYVSEEPKRKKTGIIIGAVILILALIVGLMYAKGAFGSKDPKENALHALSEYFEKDDMPFKDVLGTGKDFMEASKDGYSSEIEYRVKSIPAVPKQVEVFANNLFVNMKSASKGDESVVDLNVGMGTSNLLDTKLLVEGDTIKFVAPAVLDKTLKLTAGPDLKERIDKAYIFRNQTEQDKEMAAQTINSMIDATSKTKSYALLPSKIADDKKLEKIFKKYNDSAKVSESGLKETVTFKGKEVTAKGVKLEYTKEDVLTLLSDLKELFCNDAEFKKDVTDLIFPLGANPYLDSKGDSEGVSAEKFFDELIDGLKNSKIEKYPLTIFTYGKELVSVETELNESADKGVALKMVTRGCEFPFENVNITIQPKGFEGNNEKVEIVTNGAWEKDDYKYSANLSSEKQGNIMTFDGDFNKASNLFNMNFGLNLTNESPSKMGLELSGAFKDVKKGKSYTTDISDIKLISNGAILAEMSGLVKIDTNSVKIDKTEFEAHPEIDVLEMNEAETNSLLNELQQGIKSLYGNMFGR